MEAAVLIFGDQQRGQELAFKLAQANIGEIGIVGDKAMQLAQKLKLTHPKLQIHTYTQEIPAHSLARIIANYDYIFDTNANDEQLRSTAERMGKLFFEEQDLALPPFLC